MYLFRKKRYYCNKLHMFENKLITTINQLKSKHNNL